MTTLTVDLTKNPELAALVADKEPGDWITLEASIKSKDDQTLVVRLEKCDDCDKPERDDEEAGETADDAEPDEKPEMKDEAPAKPARSLADRILSQDEM